MHCVHEHRRERLSLALLHHLLRSVSGERLGGYMKVYPLPFCVRYILNRCLANVFFGVSVSMNSCYRTATAKSFERDLARLQVSGVGDPHDNFVEQVHLGVALGHREDHSELFTALGRVARGDGIERCPIANSLDTQK